MHNCKYCYHACRQVHDSYNLVQSTNNGTLIMTINTGKTFKKNIKPKSNNPYKSDTKVTFGQC